MKTEITKYIGELNRLYKSGAATEYSYRSALENLLKSIVSPLEVTNEPKRMTCGAPDYIVTREGIPMGYLEAKEIGADLNGKQYKEQLDRYKKALNNLIITDYIKFVFYENEQYKTEISIAYIDNEEIKGKTDKFNEFVTLVLSFSRYTGQSINNSERLSAVMASKARLLAKILENSYTDDEKGKATAIYSQLKGFRQALIPNISNKEFSDIYAQTIAYGMFAARINSSKFSSSFNRNTAAQNIPHSNPFLRKLFQYIAGFDLDKRIRWVVDDLADLFNYVDIAAIIKEFGKSEHDPIIHFYETFLAKYDAALRKSRGVWYTPQAVVKFIVQAVDDILRQDFGLAEGLADASKIKMQHRVQILDPATGTGTFLAEVVQNIYKNFSAMQGAWQSYASDHLIPRINGFEILMASYVMAHLKLDLLLQQTGYKHPEEERLRIYLTNSLDEARDISEIPFAQWLFDEATQASEIKRDMPIMVVLGNPPYSGESQNSGEWMSGLMDDYKKEPQNESINIPDTKWVNNDYVKFIRLGQRLVEKNNTGILAYITDNSFLDSLSFRGMRYHLLRSFDKIYILNLHGNSLKKEKAPDGSKDENVFDIMQGVSINIFVKTSKSKNTKSFANVYHADLYGKRSEKYSFLMTNKLKSVQWKLLQPFNPNLFFVPKDFTFSDEYEKGFKIDELFQLNGVGICSKRDKFTIHETKGKLIETINRFVSLPDEKARKHFNLGDDTDWKLSDAKKDLTQTPDFSKITKINYRPFDIKFTYHSDKKGFHARPVFNIMQHFIKEIENYGLVVGKQCDSDWRYVFITKDIADLNLIAKAAKFGAGYVFPLYLFIKNGVADNDKSPYHKRHNLNETIIDEFSKLTGLEFTAEADNQRSKVKGQRSFAPIDVLDYIYAILHSPAYRERYKEFLKIDFPRVRYPQDAGEFWRLVSLGSQLRRLHLMEDDVAGAAISTEFASFPVADGNEIDGIKYINDKVFINDKQYFNKVPSKAWNFYIGGYQPAQKWLKDRKGKTLNYDDITHYRKMIYVLLQSIEIMDKIG